MTDHAQAFVNVVRAQGWLQPAHESLLANNPEAPWDALYQGGALGAEHVQWAIQQVQAQLPPPPNPAPQAVTPLQAAPQVPLNSQAPTPTTPAFQAPVSPNPSPSPALAPTTSPPAWGGNEAPADAWEAAVTKHESGEFAPPGPQETAPPEPSLAGATPVVRQGEMQALSLEDLADTRGELPSLSMTDLDSGPTADLGVPNVGLAADAVAVINLIVENGMGTRSFLEQKFAVKKSVDAALQTELSSAQFLVETLAVSPEEIRELARLTQNPLLEINPNSGAIPSMDDAIIEAKIQNGELDPGLRQAAQGAQQVLKSLGIERHETGLIRHFMALKKAQSATPLRRSTSSPQIKRSKTVVHAEDKNSKLMPIMMVTAVVLALVAIPFLKRLKPPENDEVASSEKRPSKTKVQFTELRPETKNKGLEKRVKVDTSSVSEEKDRADRPAKVEDNEEPEVKTIGEINKEKAAKKSRGLKLLEAEAFVRQALEAHKEENSEGAVALAEKAMQSYQSLSLNKRAQQCERLRSDLKNYQELQTSLFPKSITDKKGERLSLNQFKGMTVRVVEAIPGGARAKLSVGGSTDLIWKTMVRNDVYTVLSTASAPRPFRMSLATLALLENEDVAHALFRTLWNDLPGHREEISSRLALALRPGRDGFRINKGRFVAAGQGTDSSAPLLVARKITDKDAAIPTKASEPKVEQVDPDASYRALLVAIKEGKTGLGSQWKSFKKSHWAQLKEAQKEAVIAALKRGHGRHLKELDKVIQKASRVKVAANAKKKLKELRDYALAGIYDKVLYPDANHGRAGQPEIDDRVNALRTLWERGMAKLRSIPKARTLKSSLVRSKSLLIDAGLSADDPLFLTSFKSITENYRYCTGISALDGQLRSRDGLHYDMQVLAFNKALKGVPDDCRRQVRILNEYRMMQGRHCLAINLNLTAAAKKHCAWMQESGTFSHTSTLPGLKTPRQRAKASGYKSPFVGENIAKGQPSAGAVHKAWYNSAPHHRNMLEKVYYEIGVGHVGQHWTQLFGGGRPALR